MIFDAHVSSMRAGKESILIQSVAMMLRAGRRVKFYVATANDVDRITSMFTPAERALLCVEQKGVACDY